MLGRRGLRLVALHGWPAGWLARAARVGEKAGEGRAGAGADAREREVEPRRWASTRSPSAARELEATGETARKRSVESLDQLTAREAQIARLARDGLSNPEIGARLFLSPRTVEWHLGKVFTKLGISSRMGLNDALPSPDREASPA
jgi:DNA-binding CsgD family transcriptional regulator